MVATVFLLSVMVFALPDSGYAELQRTTNENREAKPMKENLNIRQVRASYTFNHPPFEDNFEPIPVAVVYDDNVRKGKSGLVEPTESNPTTYHPMYRNLQDIKHSETDDSTDTNISTTTLPVLSKTSPELLLSTSESSPTVSSQKNKGKSSVSNDYEIPVVVVYEENVAQKSNITPRKQSNENTSTQPSSTQTTRRLSQQRSKPNFNSDEYTVSADSKSTNETTSTQAPPIKTARSRSQPRSQLSRDINLDTLTVYSNSQNQIEISSNLPPSTKATRRLPQQRRQPNRDLKSNNIPVPSKSKNNIEDTSTQSPLTRTTTLYQQGNLSNPSSDNKRVFSSLKDNKDEDKIKETNPNDVSIVMNIEVKAPESEKLPPFNAVTTPKKVERNRKRDPVVPIIKSENFVYSNTGDFHYSYEGGDGTKAFEKGVLRSYEDNLNGEAVEGGFSYTDKDGKDFSLTYTADENGYRPVGAHLPTPPPIPPAIARALEYLATKTTPVYDEVTESLEN